MTGYRTDLALEAAKNIFSERHFSENIQGASLKERLCQGYRVTDVTISTPEAENAIGKPRGDYITVDLQPYFRREQDFFHRGVACLSGELRALLPGTGEKYPVLVVGLGNRSMTPDAIGPLTLEHLLVTRHMVRTLPRQFSSFTPVSAMATDVLGRTGMDASEIIRGAVAQVCPAAVIAIDALAARDKDRLCATVQLSDTGLIPGSGVGNHRRAVNAESLGVPVIAAGIPTVIDAHTLCGDLLEEAGKGDFDVGHRGENLFVTPRDIDQRVRELSRLLGYAINAALQPDLTEDDITGLLG